MSSQSQPGGDANGPPPPSSGLSTDVPSADTAEEPDFRAPATDPPLWPDEPANNTPSLSGPVTTPAVPPESLSLLHRSLLAAFGGFLLAGFLLAASLTPDARGFGTHRSLGLPPCSMKVMFNTPCPACGMTTSFAHFVRGQLPSSLRANAAGTVLAVICLALLPWSLYSAWRGHYFGTRDPATTFAWSLTGLAGFTLLHWIWRLWMDGRV